MGTAASGERVVHNVLEIRRQGIDAAALYGLASRSRRARTTRCTTFPLVIQALQCLPNESLGFDSWHRVDRCGGQRLIGLPRQRRALTPSLLRVWPSGEPAAEHQHATGSTASEPGPSGVEAARHGDVGVAFGHNLKVEVDAVHAAIESKRSEIETLCRQLGVRRLDLFGSATSDVFDTDASDVDVLVEFDVGPNFDYFDAYFRLKEGLEAILGRPVDVITAASVRNPYFRARVEQTKETLYAA